MEKYTLHEDDKVLLIINVKETLRTDGVSWNKIPEHKLDEPYEMMLIRKSTIGWSKRQFTEMIERSP